MSMKASVRTGHRPARFFRPALRRAAVLLIALVAGGTAAQARDPVVREVFAGNVVWHQAVCDHALTLGTSRCHAQIRTDAAGTPLQRAADPTVLAAAARGMAAPAAARAAVVPAGTGPADLHSAYNIPANATGSAATIVAIVDAFGYPNAEADLAVYRAQYGLPPCTTANGCFRKVNQNGTKAYPVYNVGWSQESALDLDMVSAMCPGCKIILVETTTNGNADLAAGVNEAVALGAMVVSNSYGGTEYSGDLRTASAYNHPGVAITASTGDQAYGAQSPAVIPGVIAVGGTALVRASNARGWSESVWKTSASEGTGSGCSSVFAKPAWQTDPGCHGRMEADISAVADPATGVAVYGPTGGGSRSAWLVFGGTSVSAPLIGGLYGAAGSGAASGARPIWQDAGAHTYDVTTGNNGACSTAYFCTAEPGYDGPTGWGTPNGLSILH